MLRKLEVSKLEAIIADYSKLYTCAVSDAIDELGLEPGFIDAEIRPMWPGARILGFAGTMKMIPSEEPLDRNIIARLVKFMRKTPKFPI